MPIIIALLVLFVILAIRKARAPRRHAVERDQAHAGEPRHERATFARYPRARWGR